MANYDAEVRVSTKVDTSQMQRLQMQIDKAAMKVEALTKKCEDLKNQQVPTEAFTALESKLQSAQAELQKLIAEENRLAELGLTVGAPWDNIIQKESDAQLKIEAITAEMQKMKEAGTAFTGIDPEKIRESENELYLAKGNLSALVMKCDELNAKQDANAQKSRKVSDGLKRIGEIGKKSFSRMNSHAKKSSGLFHTMATRLKGILLSLLIFNWITKGFNNMVNGMKKGFKNLVLYSEEYNKSVSALKSANTQLQNSWAAAFMPIVQAAIPHLITLINCLTSAANAVAQFTAVMTGKSTWVKATAVQEDYAASLDGTAASAKKAAKALASFDTLEVLNKNDSSGGGSGTNPKDMFEEVPVDPKLESNLDKIKETVKPILDYFDDLKDIFIQGFWDGLGDWEYRLESIKDSVRSIKDSLVDIFTDPAVVSAADGYFKSLDYLISVFIGAMASVGLTIAAMVLGGIEKYLEQNNKRIKEAIVSIFNIKEEIHYLLSDALIAFAYVFEAFASENGQQLMANLIGIFADAYMGIEEFLLKAARDILNIIIQPFVENKEALRSALEDFLGVLTDVTGTIKDAIDNTFDHLNDVYDAHLKPFFDSVASGLSELLGHLLNFWSVYAQPILQELSALIDYVWKSHIQPAINSVIDLLGGLADMLKALWENIIKPLHEWLIDNVLPAVAIVIGGVSEIVVGLVGIIADVIHDITSYIQGIVEFLTNVFQGDWESAWNNIVNVLEAPIMERFKNAGKNLMDGLVNGIKNAYNSVTDTISNIATNIKDTFCSLLGIHSPSTVFEQFGVYLLQGLANGINSAIDLVGSAISGIVENILGMFDFNEWTKAGQEMINSIVLVIGEFKEIWNTSFTEWSETNNELYFGYDIWYEQFYNILLAYTDVNGEFMSEWQANMDTWWTTMVIPFFTVAQWQLFGTNMKTGIMQGFKVIVNEIGGVLNNIIKMFDSAFKELEDSMNDLIDSYNSSAGVLGTSTLSRVHYKPMGGIKIPALADGAVIRGGNPFLAILGDQPSGQTNIEAPQGAIEEAVTAGLRRAGGNGGTLQINLNYDGETFARLSLKDILAEMDRQGYDIDVLGGLV